MTRHKLSKDNVPPTGAAAKVEKWASEAAGVKAIARRLGASLETFNIWCERHPELRDALDAGREAEHQMLYNALLKHLEKSPTPAIFLLKARHGYREGEQTESTNKVSITFNLPGAMPVSQFLKQTTVVEHKGDKDD